MPRVIPKSAPRAPKSHTGVAMPSRAGTNHTSPVSSHAAAISAELSASGMSPMSSRSHSMQLPADSIIASTP